MITCYTVPEIWHVTDVIIFHFGPFFALLAPNSPKKSKLKKKIKKNARRYHHFTYVYQKLWSDDVRFLRYGVRQMDRQTDRQTDGKSDILRWVPHLKIMKTKSEQTWNIFAARFRFDELVCLTFLILFCNIIIHKYKQLIETFRGYPQIIFILLF